MMHSSNYNKSSLDQNCTDYNQNLVRLSSFQWMLDVWDTIDQIGQIDHVFRRYHCPTKTAMNADKFDILFAIPFPKSVLSYANPNSKESVILWPFHCICQAIREYSKESATIMIKCTINAQSYSQRWCIVQTTIKRQNCADYNPNLVRLSSFQWMLDVWDIIVEQIGQLNHVYLEDITAQPLND
jgi:hypothetical protein